MKQNRLNVEDTFSKLYLFLPLLIGMLLYTVGITHTDLWTPDEPRYAEIAREMIERGNYIQPYLNGMPYTEKPPLFFWTVVACAKLFGGVNQLSVRLPSMLSALGTLALMIILVSNFFDRKAAFLSSIILCISPEFFWLSRSGHIDMLLTFLITASLVSFYHWHVSNRSGYLIIFYSCLAIAMLAKGPIGILLPLMVVLCFLMFRKEWNKINKMRLYFGVPIAIVIVLAWYIPATQQSTGYDFGPMVKRQIIGRLFHPSSHGVSISYWAFYHFKSLSFGMAPWTFLLPWAVVHAYQSRQDAPSFFLFCWAGVIFVFFTLIASKRELYILPMYPAVASLIAVWIKRSLPSLSLKPFRGVSVGYGVIILLTVAMAPAYLNHRYPDVDVPFYLDWDIALLLTGGGVIAISAGFFGKKHKHIIGAIIVSTLIVFMVMITNILPWMNEYKSPRDICNAYIHIKDTDSEIAMLGGARPEYVFYTKSLIKTIQTREELKEFFNSSRKMFCFARERDCERVLKNPDFPIHVVVKERVSSRIMLLLYNQKVTFPLVPVNVLPKN